LSVGPEAYAYWVLSWIRSGHFDVLRGASDGTGSECTYEQSSTGVHKFHPDDISTFVTNADDVAHFFATASLIQWEDVVQQKGAHGLEVRYLVPPPAPVPVVVVAPPLTPPHRPPPPIPLPALPPPPSHAPRSPAAPPPPPHPPPPSPSAPPFVPYSPLPTSPLPTLPLPTSPLPNTPAAVLPGRGSQHLNLQDSGRLDTWLVPTLFVTAALNAMAAVVIIMRHRGAVRCSLPTCVRNRCLLAADDVQAGAGGGGAGATGTKGRSSNNNAPRRAPRAKAASYGKLAQGEVMGGR
jgi:hypothetical protein